MERIRLEIIGMSYSQSQSGAYALILGEHGGVRRLPIIIGGFEAQAIAVELEKMKPSRPLTHDLFKNFAEHYNIFIKEVVIDKFLEGVFFAKLICLQGENESEIDARTSDAVALAIRFRCPIYTNENIMSEAGIVMDDKAEEMQNEDEETIATDSGTEEFTTNTMEELEEMLQKAISNEEYEKASKIRDEITKRTKN
ncbi:MAG: bifunctional nuclease family protein [Bacteroidetes bacterium]|nr:bifunctional nuclease family protein [Bacteroidota bacterium]MCK5764866.1 bifunctional nuclease family protein [Bacteroidales bacterium]